MTLPSESKAPVQIKTVQRYIAEIAPSSRPGAAGRSGSTDTQHAVLRRILNRRDDANAQDQRSDLSRMSRRLRTAA